MAKHVTLLGTSHRLQGAEKSKFNIDDPIYTVVVDRLMQGKDFIFEEATGLGPTTAEKLAHSKLGPISTWISTPPQKIGARTE